MSPKLSIAIVVGLLIAVGFWNIRFLAANAGESPEQAQNRLKALPMTIGGWIGQDEPVNERHMNAANFSAFVSRKYRNPKTDAVVSVMLLYGRPGDLGAHDPEFCYGGSGYREIGIRKKRTVLTGNLWSARFDRPDQAPTSIEVCWGWGDRGTWEAPDDPRYAFANRGRMYKMYVQQARTDSLVSQMDEFTPELCRELRKVLNP